MNSICEQRSIFTPNLDETTKHKINETTEADDPYEIHIFPPLSFILFLYCQDAVELLLAYHMKLK